MLMLESFDCIPLVSDLSKELVFDLSNNLVLGEVTPSELFNVVFGLDNVVFGVDNVVYLD